MVLKVECGWHYSLLLLYPFRFFILLKVLASCGRWWRRSVQRMWGVEGKKVGDDIFGQYLLQCERCWDEVGRRKKEQEIDGKARWVNRIPHHAA